MKRRDFLLASCALTAASTSTNATSAENTDKIKKAVKYHMVSGKLSVQDKFQLVKDLGFDGIETRVALGEKNKSLVEPPGSRVISFWFFGFIGFFCSV